MKEDDVYHLKDSHILCEPICKKITYENKNLYIMVLISGFYYLISGFY